MSENILEIRDLSIHFYTEDGDVAAVNGVNINIGAGEAAPSDDSAPW